MLRLISIGVLLLAACARPSSVPNQPAEPGDAAADDDGHRPHHRGHGTHAHGGTGEPCEACARRGGAKHEHGEACEACDKNGQAKDGKSCQCNKRGGHGHGHERGHGHRHERGHGHGHEHHGEAAAGHAHGDEAGDSRSHEHDNGHGTTHEHSRGHGHDGADSGHQHGEGHGTPHDHAHGHQHGGPSRGGPDVESTNADATAASDDDAAGKPDHYARRFANAERWSKSFDNPKRDRRQKPAHVVELMNIEAGMTVADIGAGTGYFIPHLSRAVGDSGSVLALDVEADMIRFVTERAQRDGFANVQARTVADDDPGLAPDSVDRILIVNTWHHIGGRVPYTKKLAAALRPGGTVTIVDYTLDAPRGPPRNHRLPAAKVVEELQAGGLDARVVKEDLPMQYIVVGTRR